MNIPAVPIVISEFYEQETEKARNEGLPGLRTEWIRGPVWAKTREQLRRDVINGNSPISGKPVMQEIVDKFTKPLTAEEKKKRETSFAIRVRRPLPILRKSCRSCLWINAGQISCP